MSFYQPIYWRQGTFLEPQHFQLLELQQLVNQNVLMGSIVPWPWGFTDLEINQDALLNYDFEIIKMDLFLHNGRRLIFPGNVNIKSRSFRKAWSNPDEDLFVMVSIPHFSRSTPNVVEDGGDGSAKDNEERIFSSSISEEGVPDLLGGGPPSKMETLIYNATIVFQGEGGMKDAGFHHIPVAKLYREGERVRLANFSPPTLNIYQNNPLHDLMADVVELLRAKGRQLEEYKISPNQSRLREGTPISASLVMTLLIVSKSIAKLHNLISAPALHPYTAFCALRELMAELTIFAPGISALGEPLMETGKALPPYDHSDPYPSFLETRNLTARLLDSINPGPELIIPFRRDGTNFLLDFPQWMDMGFVCWISLHAQDPAAARDSLLSYGKLSSPGRLPSIINYNLPGIALNPLRDAPVGLPRRPDTVYFAIRREDPLWDEAIKSGHLTMFWDNAPEGAQLTLTGNRI
jgi:type VI secretion system protein ImpJ